MRRQPSRDTLLVDSKDVDARLASAAQVVRATYLHPYQMHGSVGASCAVADVKADSATIWSPTQGVYPQRDSCAMLLGLPKEQVKVIYTRGSGCYGINGADTVSYDAALMSQAAGRPVRVQLSRQDEMAYENFGLAFVVDQRVGLDRDGNIIAWDYEAWSPVRGGRPGYARPGNQVTGYLAGFPPAALRAAIAGAAAGRPAGQRPERGAVVRRGRGRRRVRRHRHRQKRAHALSHRRVPVLDRPATLAQSAAEHLRARMHDGRARGARRRPIRSSIGCGIFAIRDCARSCTPPQRPRTGRPNRPWRPARTGPVVSGRGIACVLYEGDNGYCAMVAEVDVHRDTGAIDVKRLVMALDCGPISNPDGLRNQAEGGALHGLSRALFEEVTWDHEKVTSVDWRTLSHVPGRVQDSAARDRR